MEARIIILLACVSVTLFINTIIIWLVFRIFGNLATKVTEGVHEFQTGASTRQWLATAQTASENAVKVTGIVREELAAIQPALERMQAEHSERLATAEVRFKLMFKAIALTSETIEKFVTWPVRNLWTVVSVIEGIFTFIRGTERGSDARSRRSQ